MTEPRRFQAADALLCLSVLAVAFAVRAAFLLTLTSPQRPSGWQLVQDPSPPEDDAQVSELSALFHHFKADQGFVCRAPFAAGEELTAHTEPGYPILLGLLARVVDDRSLQFVVSWLQCLLGSFTAALYFLFARRAFRSLVVGTLAGLACALNPFWVLDTAALADGTLASFLLACAIFLGARGIQTGGPLSSLLYGLALAALSLVRAACLPFAFVAVCWYLWRSRNLPRGWLCALLAFLGFVNGLAPWTVRNLQVFGEPVPVVDSAYYHLWVGNNPHATGGPVTEAAVKDAEARVRREDPGRPLADLGQPERFARLGRLARDEIRDDSLRAVRRRVRAALDFVFGEHWFRTGELAVTLDNSEHVATMPAFWERAQGGVLHGWLLATLLLAALGWRWSYGWRHEAMPLALALVWIPLPYVLGHAAALSGPRLPLDGVLLCYAAFAVGCGVPLAGRRLFAGAPGGGTC